MLLNLFTLLGSLSLLQLHLLASCGSVVSSTITEEVVESFDGVKLVGTLSLPADPRALVIPVHGSFLQDRNGALDGTKKWMFPEGVPSRQLFKEISDAVLPVRIATFRFDKRASGQSGGNYENTDLIVLAQDLMAVTRHFRARFPRLPIGIIGQSEGGLVTVKACELGLKADFLILQAPALEPFDLAFELQRKGVARPFLDDPTGEMARKYPYVTAFYRAWESGDLPKKARTTNKDHYTLVLGSWRHVTSLRKYRQYLWDGVDLLRKISVPTAIFIGTEDGNVRRDWVDRVAEEKKRGRFPLVDIFVLPGLEHSFREYSQGESLLDSMAKPVSTVYTRTLTHYLEKVLNP